jgi:uncharacterized membrane protein
LTFKFLSRIIIARNDIMKNDKIKKLVFAAMFAALTCAATMVIQIPSPMEGYLNAGDALVLISAWVLGPWYGGAAAGIGSMLADLLTGYAYYAPATFIIKAAVAIVASLLASVLVKLFRHRLPARLIGSFAGEIIMVLGYFAFSALIRGKGLAAAASIPGNCFQALFGIAVSIAAMAVIDRKPLKK